MYSKYSNLTGHNYVIKPSNNGKIILLKTIRNAADALPIVSYGGPYCCPYHYNSAKGAECIQRAPFFELIESINSDLSGIQARMHKQYFKSYFRQLLVCTHPDPRFPIPDKVPRTKDGKPLFLVESGIYHFKNKSQQGLPQRCFICSNLVKHSPYGKIWKIEKRISSLIQTAFCLRCNSQIHFGSIGRINISNICNFSGRKKHIL